MLEEGPVLGRKERLDELGRIFLERELDAALAGKGLHRLAVQVSHACRQSRLVGQQRFSRGKALGKQQPQQEIADDRQGEQDRNDPRPAPRPEPP
jgi:hypothetical protein